MAECACACLIFTSFLGVPSLCISQVFELVHFFQRFPIHPNVSKWFSLDAVDENIAFVVADFHTVSSSCPLQL